MAEFIRADKSLKADVLDFINYVFSHAHCPHDFKKLIPKVYRDEKEAFNGIHYAAVEEGKIRAVITNLLMEEQVGGQTITYGMIGNVSVHPYARGKGYMKALMKMVKEDAQKDGADVLVLGGQRQRYQYFGFEPVGVRYRFQITKTNIRHCMKQTDCSAITFEKMEDPDAPELAAAKALYEKRPAHGIRPLDEFLFIMRNWASDLYIIRKAGEMIGYLYGNARELVLEKEADLAAVLKAWTEQKGVAEMNLTAYAFEKERISYLSTVCEGMSVEYVEQVCVLNWKKVLQAMLALKNEYEPLQDGETTVGIEGEAFRICVTDGAVSVEKMEGADTDHSNLTVNEAQMLLFGMQNLLNPKKEFKNWLPIPFFVDAPDEF